MKKSKALLGGGIGLLVGAAVGAAAASGSNGSNESSFQIFSDSEVMAMGAAAAALLGLGIGAAIGGIAGTDKTIQVEGKADSEVEEILEYLRKKARIPDYK